MNLQFLETCVKRHQVINTPQWVTVSTPNIPLPNVLITVLYTFNGGFGYFTNTHMRGRPWGFNVTKSSEVRIIAALKPAFKEVNANGNFVFDFGVGDGTGDDFDGTEGAEVIFKFSNGLTDSFTPNAAPVIGFPLYPLNSTVAMDYLLHLDDSHFNNAAASHTSVTITIPPAAPGSRNAFLIEQMVELHIFDGQGRLKCIMDLNQNREVTINYGSGGFTMMALINGHPNAADANNFIFEIGDPITDASVSVSSRNP